MLIEVDRQQLGLHVEGIQQRGRSAGLGDISHDLREPLTRCANLLEERLVLGGRPEAELVRERRRSDLHDSALGRQVDGQAARAGIRLGRIRKDLVVLPPDVLGEQQANVIGVAPELAVRRGSLLKRSERLNPLIRLGLRLSGVA